MPGALAAIGAALGASAATAATVGATAVATAVSAATAIGTGIAGHQESAKQAQAQRVAANKAVTAVPTTTSPEVQDMAAQARRRAALARGQSSTNIVGQSGLGGGSKLGNVGIG